MVREDVEAWLPIAEREFALMDAGGCAWEVEMVVSGGWRRSSFFVVLDGEVIRDRRNGVFCFRGAATGFNAFVSCGPEADLEVQNMRMVRY